MEQKQKIYQLINQSFKNLTLCLGGIFLLNKIDEKLIWTITNSLEDIYTQTIDELDKLYESKSYVKKEKVTLHPHPAVESLLNLINIGPKKSPQ